MHVLCNNLIINLDPQLTSSSDRRPTKLHEEKTVCVSTSPDTDKL